ncbi:MAG: DUF1217 domain-containing protein [Rhodospirillaceae bacterium]|nr:DUF1217 domain-containing protein [Rhodospirillaceae bacterium]
MSVSGVGLSATMLYSSVTSQWERRIQDYQEQPTVDRAVRTFMERIALAESPEEVLDDYELRTFILQAYNIDEELHNATGLLKRVLLDDLEGEDALVYQMQDQRFLKMATDLRMDQGLEVLQSGEGQLALIDQYYTVGLEMQVGDQNAAVREVLYFERSAGEAESLYQVLSDNALRTVVMGAYGLPEEMAYLDVDKQAEMLGQYIDVERLGEEDYRNQIIDRYLLAQDRESASTTYSGVLSLFQPVAGYDTGLPTFSIGLNLLT